MTIRPNKVYLERRTYRRRRMMDAARLLPLLGVLLFLVPMLWLSGQNENGSTARGVIYIFAIWAILISVSAWIAARLENSDADETGQDRPG